jgi:hypothetical protein
MKEFSPWKSWIRYILEKIYPIMWYYFHYKG